MPTQGDDEPSPSLTTLLVRLGFGLFTLLIAFGLLAWSLQEPLEAFSAGFVEWAGLPGVVILITIVDALPLTHEPILFLAWSGGLGFVQVWVAASTGSIAAGAVGWCGGRLLGRSVLLQRTFERYHVTRFLHDYGVWAVAIAAFTPFPFAMVTWCSGAVGLPLRQVMLGSLFRIPKVLLYLSIIAGGWNLPSFFASGGP